MPRHSMIGIVRILVVSALGLASEPAARGQQQAADDPRKADRQQVEAKQRQKREMTGRPRAVPAQAGAPVENRIGRDAAPIARAIVFDEMPWADDDPEDDETEQPANSDPVAGRVIAASNFDRWVFGEGGSAQATRAWLDELLSEEIERVSGRNRLSAVQREKLRLAGRGDMKRFFDLVDENRREFEIARQDFRAGLVALRRLRAQGLAWRSGLFGRTSLFSKVLMKMVRDEVSTEREAPGR